ncbi:MAG: tetratricopeptide repeat protein [Candidatus Latescibacteria bacterium]|mgnify:CR=1 FL=1|jgi:TolA-binding protein|nr:tetratricopeptide repeat protein [Candidatus Latescibacterota bacterium]
MYRKFALLFFFLILPFLSAHAQKDKSSGIVLSVSGKTVFAQFEDIDISVGDIVEIQRYKEIIDPIDGKVRGTPLIKIARGVIDDFGLGKASIRILEMLVNDTIETDDIVIHTGQEKRIIRTQELTYGEIQDISEEEIVTSLGSDDDISEGDVFLVQRTEPVYDPETNEVTGTRETTVGRTIVDSVSPTSSTTRIIEQTVPLESTDNVVRESDYLAHLAFMQSDSVKISMLEEEVASLKKQIRTLRSNFDSLGYEQSQHRNEFETLKRDIESVLPKLMSGDIQGTTITINNDEPVTRNISSELFELYRQSLNNCLDRKFQRAVQGFQMIIERYPDSKLTENCRYWIAQSYFSLKNFTYAAEEFKSVLADTRFKHKDDDASIMLGITYYRMNEPDEARAEFQKFIENYPDSEYRNKVNYWINQLS